MKISIMQPYFFPYLGYFNLINNVDLFVVYDVVQYVKRGWINRNRILHQDQVSLQYIVVPVIQNHQKTPIMNIKISHDLDWRQKIIGQLSHYRNRASYGKKTIDFVHDCLDISEDSISRLNTGILNRCANLLGIKFQYQFCSELNIELDKTHDAEEKILDLCEFLGATEYLNLPGGVNLYNAEIFMQRGVKLTFLNLPALEYQPGDYVFEPNLSIIDLLMWNRPEVIREHMNKYRGQ